MKKVVMMLLAVFALSTVSVQAQNKQLEKQLKKEYKAKMKEFKKGKWEIFGSSRSLEVALLTHYDKLQKGGDEVGELVGIASKFKSKNVGHQVATNNACNTYARSAGRHVKGRVVSDIATDGDDVSNEFDKFYAAYESLVEKEIKGEMKESFSIIRNNDDGTYEMQTFFIVDQNAASKARIRAYENAAKESVAAQKYATQVSDFIKEGFKVETRE